jgi:hypothetical protein
MPTFNMHRVLSLLVLPLLGGATSSVAQTADKAHAPDFTRVGLVDPATDRANSQGAAWIDIEADGDLDLFVVNVDNSGAFLYRNDGAGNLTRVTSDALAAARLSRGVCAADYDNDDDVDVLIVGIFPQMLINDGSGDFTLADLTATFGDADLRGWACAWADFDLDGFVDVVITHPAGFVGVPSVPNHLFRNLGNGTLQRITESDVVTGLAPYTVATWSDHDLDGDPDLFIGAGPANGTPGPDFIYHNLLKETGSADLVRVTDGPLATRNRDGQVFNWIDYDNDGDLDVYLTNWGGVGGGMRDELYRNDGGSLTEITSGSIVTDKQVSLASVWGDFDNDGDLDTYVSDGNAGGTSRFYDNNGDGTFTRLLVGPIINDQGVSWGATAGDYDNDGDLDLFVANASGVSLNFLYRNNLASDNHWLKVQTIGTASNRSGIGAIVRAKATIKGAPTWMMREVSSQNSFNGHNELTLHFGLGDAGVVDSLYIVWPSGAQDLYEAVDVDQTIIATEGESPTTVAVEDEVIPAGVTLYTNYPNPAVDVTSFAFDLPHTQKVVLTVYDALGRSVSTPVSAVKTAGRHDVQVNVSGLPSGPYVYRLTTEGQVMEGVMVVVR